MPSKFPTRKVKICHVSVLNPALHTRIFHKEALSLVEAGFAVAVIGQDASLQPYEKDGVRIVPIYPFSRKSIRRLLAPFVLLERALDEQADIYIVHTPELTGLVWWLRLFRRRTRVIYDVHEDYYRNIRYGNSVPNLFRRLVSRFVWLRDRQLKNRANAIALAEDCYPGHGQKSRFNLEILLRNKFCLREEPVEIPAPEPGVFRLVFTGTISSEWGIWETVDLWEGLNQHYPVELVVVGHTHSKSLLKKLDSRISSAQYPDRFRLVGGRKYVPHGELLGWIKSASAGTAFYSLKKHLKNKIPTKFYEFMALGTPLLFSWNPTWNDLNSKYGFGMGLSFPLSSGKLEALALTLQNASTNFYRDEIPEEAWSWDTEAEKLVDLCHRLTPGELKK